VLAVKGIGGYHLMCDATSTAAVDRLRSRKPRPHKPLAIMFPAPAGDPFEQAESFVSLNETDRVFLLQSARPILLVKKAGHSALSEQVAPGLNEAGVMLPYSPLHHLLLNGFGGPLVATSANLSGEPVLIENREVERRLGHVADAFLHHNRPIERPADDPVYRTIAGRPRPIRSGRGLAPLELDLPFKLEQPVLAVGAHMKNAVALAWQNRVVISPHIGDMDSVRSLEVFKNTINDLQRLYNVEAAVVLCDAHPGYSTTRWASRQQLPVHRVFHHHAHAAAAWSECRTDGAVIAFTWDGVGYGEDGTLWGGETFLGRPGQWRRVACMRPFHLPGGEQAGREPWRSAAALCWETDRDYANLPEKDPLLQQAWQRKINAPQTTSVGRLFDAAAALTGVRSTASFEGQGPMEFEALCGRPAGHIELGLEKTVNLLITDWGPLVAAMLDSASSVSARAALFHASLAHALLQQARAIREVHHVHVVSFSGGVFQNRVLTEQAMALLSEDGFRVCLPELIPVNDAGISFGQIVEFGFKCRKNQATGITEDTEK
jgi:hydrogenase maturation protein HypF